MECSSVGENFSCNCGNEFKPHWTICILAFAYVADQDGQMLKREFKTAINISHLSYPMAFSNMIDSVEEDEAAHV